MKIERKGIPSKARRQLLLECGYRYSVPHCHNEGALDFHHIDGNLANSLPDNLIVLCSNHHRLASAGKIDSLACKEMKKGLETKLITYRANADVVKKMRRAIREELRKARDATGKEKALASRKGFLFTRKVLFDLLEDDLPNVYLAISILGQLRLPGGVPRIIKAVDKLRRGIRPRKKGKSLSLAARVYKIAIWTLIRYETKSAIEWLGEQMLELPREPVLIIDLITALNSSRKAKQYIGFEILKVSSGKKTEFMEIEYSLHDHRYNMRIEVVGSTKRSRK